MPFLQSQGWEIDYSALVREQDDAPFYAAGNYGAKMRILCRSLWRRMGEWRRANQYDLLFVQREGLMLGTAFFERRMTRRGLPMIFDFDDAIWQQVVSAGNRKLGFLKNANKTRDLIEMASQVWAGNAYLADYARQYTDSARVRVVPTTVDTQEYAPAWEALQQRYATNAPVCIGWSGSFTTVEHFQHALPALKIIKEKYGERVCFKLIGDGKYRNEDLALQGVAWSRNTEWSELSALDIGIMPLPDDEWTQGKCGLKALVYMSMALPCVLSPVGVNRQIVDDDVNGLWASTTEEWVTQLSRLVEDVELRYRLGAAGRVSVLENYSVAAWQQTYADYFGQAAKKS